MLYDKIAKPAMNWIDDNVVEPVTTFGKKAIKAVTSKGFAQKTFNIIKENISASAGISLGYGGQQKFGPLCGAEVVERIDIIGVQFKNGKVDIGHPGKSAANINIGLFNIGPQSEVYESIDTIERIVYEDSWFDISISAGDAKALFIGYHYDLSISILGIGIDIIEHINSF